MQSRPPEVSRHDRGNRQIWPRWLPRLSRQRRARQATYRQVLGRVGHRAGVQDRRLVRAWYLAAAGRDRRPGWAERGRLPHLPARRAVAALGDQVPYEREIPGLISFLHATGTDRDSDLYRPRHDGGDIPRARQLPRSQRAARVLPVAADPPGHRAGLGALRILRDDLYADYRHQAATHADR